MEPYVLKRDEDKAPMKKLWNRATPWVQLVLALAPVAPALYFTVVFLGEVKDAVAAIPVMQQQILQNQQSIAINKAETDQGYAVLNVKMDMLMSYLGVPNRQSRR